MTTLQPTPSRGPFRRIPVWAVVVVGVLVGALLVGAGLLLTGGSDDEPAAAPTPSCTPAPGATTPPTAKITVNVYNSTSRAGLARDTADALELRDFTVDEVANDPKKATIAGTAVVRYVDGATTTQARWVAAQVPDATVEKVSAKGHKGAKIDLVIGSGYTALAAPEEATTAFAASAPRPAC